MYIYIYIDGPVISMSDCKNSNSISPKNFTNQPLGILLGKYC